MADLFVVGVLGLCLAGDVVLFGVLVGRIVRGTQ